MNRAFSGISMLILLGASGIWLRATAVSNPIPQEHQVILQGDWTPTRAQTDRALGAAIAYVHMIVARNNGRNMKEKIEVAEAKQISQEMKRYAVQFVGRTPRGRKVIFCNFFPAGGETDWKRSLVVICDGGPSYWELDYDPATGKCHNYYAHGAP